MKRSFLRNVLGGLLLAVVFSGMPHGAAFAQSGEAHAQSGESTTPEAQSPEKNDQEIDETAAYRHSPMVRKMGGMIGLNPDQAATAFEVTNFLVLAAAVLFGLAKFIPKTIRDRNTAIQKHLVDARTATEEASLRLNSVEDRLARLDVQIAELRAHSEQDSARDEVRIKASVEDEKKRILASAEQEIASATAHAQKQLQQFAAELAIEQAGRKLVVSAETDRLLVQSFARRLTGDDSKKGQN